MFFKPAVFVFLMNVLKNGSFSNNFFVFFHPKNSFL